jgi:hypothetical protein
MSSQQAPREEQQQPQQQQPAKHPAAHTVAHNFEPTTEVLEGRVVDKDKGDLDDLRMRRIQEQAAAGQQPGLTLAQDMQGEKRQGSWGMMSEEPDPVGPGANAERS